MLGCREAGGSWRRQYRDTRRLYCVRKGQLRNKMEDHGKAILNWVRTFDAGANCANSLSELSDGRLIGDILHGKR